MRPLFNEVALAEASCSMRADGIGAAHGNWRSSVEMACAVVSAGSIAEGGVYEASARAAARSRRVIAR